MQWPPRSAAEMVALQDTYGRDCDIARAVNRDFYTVRSHRSRFGIPARGSKPQSERAFVPRKCIWMHDGLTEDDITEIYDDRTYEDA